ncbi:MAG: hypothetical protein ACREGH_04005 [Minisyncoccia bacterium]
MKNVLSYAEYQEKVKNIKSPEEAVAFAQELLTTMLTGLSNPEPEEEPEKRSCMGKRLTAADIIERQNPVASIRELEA